MFQSRKAKKIAILLTVVVLTLALSLTAFAATGSQQLTAVFRDIQIMLNGSRITPTDANGDPVEPFLVDGTTYLPVRAVGEALNLVVDWDPATNVVTLDGGATAPSTGSTTTTSQSAQVTRNVEATRALFTAQGPQELAELFADGAVFQYSNGTDPDGPMGTYKEHVHISVEEWLADVADDFQFVNDYATYNQEPIFTPVDSAYNDLIMVKANTTWTEDGEAQNEHWTLELTFNSSGQITKLRTSPDPDEAEYLQIVAAGTYNYNSSLNADDLRLLNLRTIDLWWSCRDLPRNIQRLILVTEDATKSMGGSFSIMWVGDEDGNYVEGWLAPDQSGAFPQWGFYALDHTSDPDKLFECADMPNVFLADACGNGIFMSGGEPLVYQPNYFLQFTMRDDGFIANFRELSHGLNRIQD